MGERKATNKYYPPDFDPRKHRSLDAYHGSHALRERARKLHEGILIIRFEMPYNIWCGGCGNHIGMGVRYNAEKSKVGMYYTTPIYKFRMKCHLCDNHFEIKTDPANHDYVIIEGARRKEQRWDPKENEQIVPEDKATQKKLATDAMYMLEHGVDDKAKVTAALPGIAQIQQLQTAWKDDYSLNRQLRNKFRAEKKVLNDTKARDKALLQKSSLDIELVAEEEEDKHLAHLLNKYKTVSSFDERQKEKREEIANRPMFSDGCKNSPSGSSVRNKQELQHIQSKQLVKQLAARKQTSPFLSGDRTWTVGSLGIVKRRSNCGTKNSAMVKHGDDVPRTGEDVPRTGEDVPRTGEDVPRTGEDVPRTGEDVPRTDTADGKAVNTTMSVSVDGDSKLDHSDSRCIEKKDCPGRTVPVAADGGSVKEEMHDGTADRHNCLNTIVSAYGSSSSNDSDSA